MAALLTVLVVSVAVVVAAGLLAVGIETLQAWLASEAWADVVGADDETE